MKNKKIKVFVVLLFLIGFLSVPYTYSKLNLVFTQEMSFISKNYDPLVITNTTQIENNCYQITLENNNDYEITFSCEDVASSFDVACSASKISANSSKELVVDLEFNETTDTSNLTPNPDGNGYITKIGIRITSPYAYPKTDPHYITSNDIVVEDLVATNLVNYLTTFAINNGSFFATDHSTNLRYIGSNPKNYILFNDELWRIIGIIDGKVKIIRTTPYNDTPYSFYDNNASGTNTQFQNAAIKTQLNDAFYYSIKQRYRSMVKTGNWNVGGLNTWDWQVAGTSYDTEKSSVIQANVGLISATDYVYAIGGSKRNTCIQSTHIGEVSTCSLDNWLYPYASTSGMWTLNEFTALTGYTLVVDTSGNIAPNKIEFTSAIYPVVYLDENIGFISGNGDISNPFKIKANSQTVIEDNYKDYITNVYLNSWGNELAGYAGKEITSFDKNGGALLFANDTWNIPAEYTIDQVTVYSYNWAELATYYNRTWEEDNTWHARLSNYVFKRHLSPDLDYIGGEETLKQNNGTLRFVVIVKN